MEVNFDRIKERAFAGAVIGSVCGSLFGVFDGVKLAGLKADFKLLNQQLRLTQTYALIGRQTIISTGLFSAMFCLYQVSKYTFTNEFSFSKDWELPQNVVASSVVSIAPFLPSRVMRRNLPYALVLVALDVYNGGVDA